MNLDLPVTFECGCAGIDGSHIEMKLFPGETAYRRVVKPLYTINKQCDALKAMIADPEHRGQWGVFPDLPHFPGAVVVAQL